MSFAEELTEMAFKDEYWSETVLKINSSIELTSKEFNDAKRFIDLLTLTKHKEANKIAYETLMKFEKHINNDNLIFAFVANIKANLARYEDYNFNFTEQELNSIVLERRIQIVMK